MRWPEDVTTLITIISTVWLFVEMGAYARARLPIDSGVLFWSLWTSLWAAVLLVWRRFQAREK